MPEFAKQVSHWLMGLGRKAVADEQEKKRMKPRIFFNIHYLEIGGAETSLIGLLQSLDPERVDADLFLNDPRGEMMRFLPKWVNILPAIGEYTMIERPIAEALRGGYFRLVAARLWAKVRYMLYRMRHNLKDGSAIFAYVGRYAAKVLPSLERFGEYDLAVSYLTPHDVVLSKVCAKKKACWIHTDYSFVDVNADFELPIWKGYDYIVSISDAVSRAFLSKFPSLESKIVKIENILSTDFVRARSAEEDVAKQMYKFPDEVLLLTIGRYCYAKALERIPKLCRLLGERGLKIRWYIIGYGGSDEYIRKEIDKEGVGERVILLGKKANPYPYISACDWYVQPSRYEGNSVVVREAQVLNKPVIITAYPTASSQVTDGVDGVIVPMELSACADAMAETIRDERQRESIVSFLSTHDCSNKSEAEKLYKLIV